MKIFSRTVYHGSGAEFDTFDLSFMSTGEGAQVHGWGVYLTESYDTAQGYRDKLYGQTGDYQLVFGDGDVITVSKEDRHSENIAPIKEKLYSLGWKDTPNDKMMAYLYKYDDIEHYMYKMNNLLWKLENESVREAFENNLNVLANNDVEIEFTSSGMIATVEIPDDWIFAEEGDSIEDQPIEVQEAIKELYDFSRDIEVIELPRTSRSAIRTLISKYTNDRRALEQDDTFKEMIDEWDYDEWDLTVENLIPKIDLIFKANCALYLEDDVLRRFTESFLKYINNYKVTTQKEWTFRDFYDEFSHVVNDGDMGASLELYARGVNGIHYNGETDGSCFVVFNPEGLIITQKETDFGERD